MLIGAIILPIILLFIPKDRYKLPAMFKWWDNADVYIGRDTSVYKKVCDKGYWSRLNWLAFRNPINYFDYVYMGLHWNGNEKYIVYNSDEDNIGDGTRPGYRYIEVIKGDTKYYEYYWIYQYPFKKDVCFRYRLGWKIGDNKNKVGTTSQWVFVISPWHNYTGANN